MLITYAQLSPVFIKLDQLDLWIKDQVNITLISYSALSPWWHHDMETYWPFVQGIHQLGVVSLHKGPIMEIYDGFSLLPHKSCWTNNWVVNVLKWHDAHINGLVQERRNSSALAIELCLSCTYPSTWGPSGEYLLCEYISTSSRKTIGMLFTENVTYTTTWNNIERPMALPNTERNFWNKTVKIVLTSISVQNTRWNEFGHQWF